MICNSPPFFVLAVRYREFIRDAVVSGAVILDNQYTIHKNLLFFVLLRALRAYW